MSRSREVSEKSPHNGVSRRSYAAEFSYGPRVELGYARVSTARQDLERQIEALTAVGIARERIYLDKKSGRRWTGRGCGRCWGWPGGAM